MTTSHADLEAVRSVVTSVTHHIDHKAWPKLRALFAEQVRSDYTSLFGGDPQQQAGEALVDGWRSSLARVATHHLLGPIEVHVAGATAYAACHVRATNELPSAPGGATWEVLGHYLFELARSGTGWSIAAMTLETFVQVGNTKLLAEAQGTT